MVHHTLLTLWKSKSHEVRLSLAGAATSIIFVATNTYACRGKTFVATKLCFKLFIIISLNAFDVVLMPFYFFFFFFFNHGALGVSCIAL